MTKQTASTGALTLVVEVLDDVFLPVDLDLDRLRALVPFVLAAEGAVGPWTVTIVLTDDERLQSLHRDFLSINSPTDVMTFPFDDETPGVPSGQFDQGGEVVISVERAAAHAADYGNSAAEEVRFLLVHGLLHLCGWDDGADADRARMLDRQADLITSFDRLPS